MKNFFLTLVVLCGILVFVGCKPELKNIRGQVKSIELGVDSIMSPSSMILSVDGQEKIVTLTDSRFQNGIAIQGDSVILDYIDGKDNTLRALVVTVLPRPAHEFVPSDTLITVDTKATADSIQ